jgi:hypothetical protein
MPSRRTKSKLMVGCCWLLAGVSTFGADPNESKVEKSVAQTRASLQDIDLMSKGISRSASSGNSITIDLSEGLQTSERVTVPVSSRILDVEQNSRTQRKKEWAARNWLLAGVQEQSDPDSGDGYQRTDPADGEIGQGGGLADGDVEFWLEEAMASQEASSTLSRRGRGETEELYAAGEIVNPLDSFLGEWLASSELERLDQAKGAPSNQNPVGAFSPEALAPRLTGGPLNRATVDLSEGKILDGNPYLGGWDQSEIGRFGSGPELGPKPPESGVSAGRLRVGPIDNAVLPETKSAAGEAPGPKTKEAWKPPPRTDEKYFPRLKRF